MSRRLPSRIHAGPILTFFRAFAGAMLLTLLGSCGSQTTTGPTQTEKDPALAVSLTSLTAETTMGSSPSSESFAVKNSGGGTMSWSASSDAAWASVSPASGSLAGGDSVMVSVSYASDTLSVGAHSGTITVTATGVAGSPQDVALALTVTAPPQAQLAVAPDSLTATTPMGSSPSDQSFMVKNTGDAPMGWTAAAGSPWVSVAPSADTLAAGDSIMVTVSYATDTLAVGSDTASITVTADGATDSPHAVSVILTVTTPPPAQLAVSPASLGPGGVEATDLSADTLVVTNSGGETLTWTAAPDSAWIGLSKDSGSVAAGGADTVVVTYATETKGTGTYAGHVMITGAAGTIDSPITVPVTATMTTPTAQLIHEWTFSETGGAGTTLVDSVGNANGTIVDVGANDASVGSGEVTLTGGDRSTSDYVSLPGGLLSGLTHATIEVWATQESMKSWGRIFDVGADETNYLFMSWSWGTDTNNDRAEWAGPVKVNVDGSMSPYEFGTEYQIVMTIEAAAGANGKTRVRLYRDGQPRDSFDVANRLSDLQDSLFFLGRSEYPDQTANAAFDELRVYDGVLTPAQIAQRYTDGPVADKPASVFTSIDVTPQAPNTLTSLGQTLQLTATAKDQNGQPLAMQPTFTWSSSSSGKVSVTSDGLASAVANGSADITASAGGMTGSVTVTVQQQAAEVSVSPSSYDLSPVMYGPLTATVVDQGGSALAPQPSVSWSSSDDNVASVNSSGVVDPGALGSATITASTSGATGTADITVAVPPECMPVALTSTSGETSASITSSDCDRGPAYTGASQDIYSKVYSFAFGTTPTYFWMEPRYFNTGPTDTKLITLDQRLSVSTSADGDAGLLLSGSPAYTRTILATTGTTTSAGSYVLYKGVPPQDPTSLGYCTPIARVNVGFQADTTYTHTYAANDACPWNSGKAEVVALYEEGNVSYGNIIFDITWTGMSPRLSLVDANGNTIATCRAFYNTANSCSMVDLSSGGSNNISVSTGAYFLVIRQGSASPSGTWTLHW